MRVIVTRPLAQAQTLVRELRSAGIDAVALPLIEIAALPDAQPLQRAWHELPGTALVMFVSANAVHQFMHQRPPQMAWPQGVLAASTGPGTSAALRAAGVPDEQLVEPAGSDFDSEALWSRLQGCDWRAQRVLVVRGVGGRDWLAERFAEAGAKVDRLAAYERRAPRLDAGGQALLAQALAQPARQLWLFGASEAVTHLAALAPGADWSDAHALAPHARIVAALRKLGFVHVAIAALDAATLPQAIAAAQRGSIQSGAP